MAVNEDYLNYIKDQLIEFGDIEVKKMFGGAGLYRDGVIFGIIGGGVFRLKADDTNQKDFEAKGMGPLRSEKMKNIMPYWEVPADILDNRTELAKWAAKSFKVAQRTAKKKK